MRCRNALPVPLGEVDLIVGTSAGSVLAAALRCGVTLDEMIALQRGDAGARAARGGRAGPGRGAAAAAAAVAGRVTPADAHHPARPAHDPSRSRGQRLAAPRPGPARGAAGHGRGAGRPVAGRRRRGPDAGVVGGRPDLDRRGGLRHRPPGHVRPGGRPAGLPLADAVVASCSIPGWYAPVVIDGPPVRGRRRPVVHLAGRAGPVRAGSGVRARPDGQHRRRPAGPDRRSGWNGGCGGC